MSVDNPIPEGHVAVARVRAPWGVKGQVKVDSLTDVPGRLSRGSAVFANGSELRIADVHTAGGNLVLAFDGVSTPEAAGALRDAYLTVPESAVPPASEGSYYYFQLAGMEAWSQDGERLGTVDEVMETGANHVLVVKKEDGNELLVPMVDGFIVSVDTASRRIVINPPQYE
ncbi:MAG: 16S rRNA processing protein RimM [SAR202 cluster bacterium]|nr:16S rRNA processing protein RimM [SAR202 cluster bacterium]